MYTSAELERVFLRWKSVELARTIDDGRPTKEKEVFFDISINHFHILRGGRWIVLVSPYGYVSYADLDAEEIRRVSLINPPFDTGLGVASIDEFFDAPAISFNIAISTFPIPGSSIPENDDERMKRIDVWHVNIVFDDRNQATGFHAGRLSTIEEDFSFRTGALSIRGSHLALLYKVDELYDVRIIIFDWVLANGCSTCCSCRTLTFEAGGKVRKFYPIVMSWFFDLLTESFLPPPERKDIDLP